ncbi:MAG: PAS domain S-box protein [Planctomycetes bacterium]|nr:PAS domain S-box protein [Planctomycetota bacterium]
MAKKGERQKKHRILAQTLPEGVLITDKQGTLTYVNPALEQMFGIPSTASVGTDFRKYVAAESLRLAEEAFLGCAHGKIVREVVLQAIHGDHHVFPIEVVASPIFKGGEFQGVESVVRDITARQQAQEALRRSERQFRSTFENAAIGIAYVDLDGKITQANSRFCEITGYSSQEILGKTCEDITLAEDGEAEKESLRRLGEGAVAHYSIENCCVRPNGSLVWVHMTRSIQRDEAGQPDCFIVLVEDISDRKRAEESLRQSEHRYRKLFEANLAGVYLTKPDGTILDFNEAMMRMLGYDTREEVFQHRSTDFYADPEFRKKLIYLLQRDGIVPAEEATLRRKDGSILYALGHAVLLTNEQTGEPYIQGVAIDITERKQAEEALQEVMRTLESKVADRTVELQQRARQLEKMTLELSEAEDRERRRLATILHDDLQQELAAARFQVERMRAQAQYDTSLQATAAQADHLLKDAIAKSRSLSHELSPAVMQHGDFAETLRWLANEVQAKHGLVVHVEAHGEVRSESEAIKSLLVRAAQELLFNVVKYAQVREARLRVRQCDRWICLSVADRGRGFDPQTLGEPAGFGLLSIRERVELLKGRMKIRSAPGRGSTFFIAVPRSEPGVAPPPAGAEVTVPGAAEPRAEEPARLRVLLADDHEITREGLLALLRDEPALQVVGEAANGREVVALAARLEPDVVVMDVSMPLMGGDEATRQIKARRPQTRVIALSMYDEPAMMEQMHQAGAESYVIKTAPTEELLAAIRGERIEGAVVGSP